MKFKVILFTFILTLMFVIPVYASDDDLGSCTLSYVVHTYDSHYVTYVESWSGGVYCESWFNLPDSGYCSSGAYLVCDSNTNYTKFVRTRLITCSVTNCTDATHHADVSTIIYLRGVNSADIKNFSSGNSTNYNNYGTTWTHEYKGNTFYLAKFTNTSDSGSGTFYSNYYTNNFSLASWGGKSVYSSISSDLLFNGKSNLAGASEFWSDFDSKYYVSVNEDSVSALNFNSFNVVNDFSVLDSQMVFTFDNNTNYSYSDIKLDISISGTPVSQYNDNFLGIGDASYFNHSLITSGITNASLTTNNTLILSYTDFYSLFNENNILGWQSSDKYYNDLTYTNWILHNSLGKHVGIQFSDFIGVKVSTICKVNDDTSLKYSFLTNPTFTITPYVIQDGVKVKLKSFKVVTTNYKVVPLYENQVQVFSDGKTTTVLPGTGTDISSGIVNSNEVTYLYNSNLDTDSIINQYNNAFDNVKSMFVDFGVLFSWIPLQVWSVITMGISGFAIIAIIKFIRG